MENSSPISNADRRLIHLSERDNVCVVTKNIEAGETLLFQGTPLIINSPIPLGHKVAVQAIARGQKVVKYGMPIGTATQDIQPGQHVHTWNLISDYLPSLGMMNDG